SDDGIDGSRGRRDGSDVRDAKRDSSRGVFDGDLADFFGSVNLAADESEDEMVVTFDEAGRIDDVGAANGVEDVVDGDAGGDEARGIGRDLEFRDAAALNNYCCDAVQAIHARLDVVGGDFPKLVGRDAFGSEAVADDRKYSKRKAVRFNFRGGGKFGLQTSDDGVDALEGENHVGLPVEEEVHFGRPAARDGLYALQAWDAVDGFFDGARDGDEHLVDGHDAVVDPDGDARKIGFGENGNGHRQRAISADCSEADNQEKNWAREAVKPRDVWGPARRIRMAGRRRERHRVLFLACRRFGWGRGGFFFLGSAWSFDFNLRLIREGVAASCDDFVACRKAVKDLHAILCADADLDVFDGSVIVGAGKDHVVGAFVVFVKSGGGNG